MPAAAAASGTPTSEWDDDYARVARVASQLRTRGLTTMPADQQQQQLHHQLRHHVARLDAALSALPLPLTEIQRRRRLVQHLGEQQLQLASSDFGRGSSSSGSGSAIASSAMDGGTGTTGTTTLRRSSMLADARHRQESMIDELAVGVGRLRDQTRAVREEANLHVRLLGEVEANLDAAHAGLDAETRRAAKIKENKSVLRLQLVLAGEAVLFVLLLLLGLS